MKLIGKDLRDDEREKKVLKTALNLKAEMIITQFNRATNQKTFTTFWSRKWLFWLIPNFNFAKRKKSFLGFIYFSLHWWLHIKTSKMK